MRQICFAALLLTCPAVALLAQAPARALVPLDVRVSDIYVRGRDLPNATVEITNNATGTKVVVVTGPDGRVSVPVMPGSYRIAISLAGYGSLVASNHCVVAGEPARFHAGLGPDRGSTQRPVPQRPVPQPDPTIVQAPLSLASQSVLPDPAIAEAMAFGRKSTKLSAYRLAASRGLERWHVGHLFTPFLRVATMTQVADATGKPFTASEIPRHFLEHVGWVVAIREKYNVLGSDDTRTYWVAPEGVAIESRTDGAPPKAIAPAWKANLNTQCDADVFEAALGRQFPLPAIVAAFPLDAIRPGNRIVVTYSTTADPVIGSGAIKIKAATRAVNIRELDVRNWK